MATTKQPLKKAIISLGALPAKNSVGVLVTEPRYVVMAERFAKYIGATFSTEAPKSKSVQIKKGKRAGRLSNREFVAKSSGTKYEFGYYDGTATSVQDPKRSRKIKWVPVRVPKGIPLKVFLKIFMTKITRKPAFLKTPSGVSTRFNNVE
jgi:hypothetical protein